MGIKLYRYRTFKKNWKEEAFDGIVEPSSPLYFNDPYECDFCFQEDISDEIHERKDYVEMVKKYIPLRKEEQDRILYADDLERALRMVFWAHGKSIQGSVKAFLRNDMSEMTNELRDAVRVVCLSETYDSMLMWGHYAMNHTGYCIEYEFEKDDICYSNLHPVEYTKDRYTISKNDIIDGKSDMVYKITCRKAEAWSYEKEWRIVTENYSRTRSLEVDPKTRYVLDLKENIKAFYLGAKINEKEKSEIIQFAKKNNRIVYQMILSANTYELRAERIDNV